MLTQEQIAAMTDDEADVFVASKILGMTWKSWRFAGTVPPDMVTVQPPAVSYADDHGCWERDDRATGGVFHSEWVNIPDSHSWTPAHCLDDAMEVAKKMGALGFQLICHADANGKLLWDAGWGDLTSGLWGRAERPARAVCNAVIAAYEAKRK